MGPKTLAELLAKRDLGQVQLAAQQKKMEQLIAKQVADIKQVELSSGFSEESREKAKAVMEERKLKKETAAKEVVAKKEAEIALKSEPKAKVRAEKAEKLASKNELVAKIQPKRLEIKSK